MTMNPNELMIGDLCYDKNCQPCKICSLPYEYTVVDFMRSPTDRWQISYEAITPIPLTAEILEKNGYGKEDILGNRSFVPKLLQVFDDNHIVEYQKYFDYVHELQHALRLCGLNELADNFKI